jgi:hypothetical protein
MTPTQKKLYKNKQDFKKPRSINNTQASRSKIQAPKINLKSFKKRND